MKNLYVLLFFFAGSLVVHSQNITKQILDSTTGKPIPYATIKTGSYSGVISNEDGYFSLNFKDEAITEITISCLGYQTKTIALQDFKTSPETIKLQEAINQLDEVYVTNKYPTIESIMAQVRSHIPDNYSNTLNQYQVFHRNSETVDFKNLTFEIEKASHISKKNIAAANKDLGNFSKKIRESDMIYFTDFKGDFYNFDKDSSKIQVSKATKLIDYKNDFTIDDIQAKAQKIMLTYLDTTKTYKVKTGIFKIEDSLSLKSDDLKDDNPNEVSLKHFNYETRNLLKRGQFFNNSFLMNILNPDDYDYHLDDVTTINNTLSYVISFEPQRHRAKFEGKIVVNASDYAITRLQYTYYENRHGSKVNLKWLLGVKYVEDLNEGLVLFEKDTSNIYYPKYIQHREGSYFYVNRDFKFIENSSERNKIGFSFKIEGHNISKNELLISSAKKLKLSDFQKVTQEKDAKIKLDVLSKYDKTLWENEVTIEPSKEMKAFEVKE